VSGIIIVIIITKLLPAVYPYVSLKVNYPKNYDAVSLIDKVILEEGLYVYNMHNIVQKDFSFSIAPVQSRSGSLVCLKSSLTHAKKM
jgi:hypothetical protein